MTNAGACYACHSRRVERRMLGAPAPEVLLCSECGHALRAESRNLRRNLAIQQDVFGDRASAPTKRALHWPRRHALLASYLNELSNQPGRALDIGCSTGVWLAALGGGWQKHGVELSRPAAEIARRFAGAQVHCGPIETYHAPPEWFDLVTAFAVVEHLVDPRAMVEWALRHLRPGGLLVLMTGDRESEAAVRLGRRWPLYAPPEHVHFFSARSLRRVVTEVGFRIIRTEWRFMRYPELAVPTWQRAWEKTREILGLLASPRHDHLYVFATKP